jgi:hypothetical protein
MTELERFKAFRDTMLTKMAGGAKGHYILTNAVCEAIVRANPLSLKDLGRVSGIREGTQTFEKYGKAIIDYFTKSNNF